jgi:hypothetical protein
MSRPKKIGLDYFPLDTQWDEKIKALLSIYGNDGLSWIITFWQSAYRDEFGRVNINKYFGEVLAKDSRNTPEKQNEIIKMALDIKLIKEIEPGIYTSNGIQKRIKEVSYERGAALKRYYDSKESTKERIKIPKQIKDKLKESKVKDFGDTSEKNVNNWKLRFWEYYKLIILAFREIAKDEELRKKLESMHPGLDIGKSIRKGIFEYWGRLAGWEYKKKLARGKQNYNPNMKMTLIKNIDKSKVWKERNTINPHPYQKFGRQEVSNEALINQAREFMEDHKNDA